MYKSFKDLTIKLKKTPVVNLKRSNDKILINNIYYPKEIIKPKKNKNFKIINYFKNRFLHFLSKNKKHL